MFESVWEAIEDYVVLFTIANLPPALRIIEISGPQRDPARPIRFQVVPVNLLCAAGGVGSTQP
jgi:hypothetical protein